MGKQPKRTRKGTVVHVRLSEDIHNRIKNLSAIDDRTVNKMCVRAIEAGLEKLELEVAK